MGIMLGITRYNVTRMTLHVLKKYVSFLIDVVISKLMY